MESWRPILDRSSARDAMSAVLDIAESLETGLAAHYGLEHRYPFSLGFGDAGVGLFFHYLARCGGQHSNAGELSRQFLKRSLVALMDQPMVPDLFRGTSGIAWALKHTQALTLASNPDDFVTQIDGHLLNWSTSRFADAEFQQGLAGASIYALEEPAAAATANLRQAIVRTLQDAAVAAPRGVAWPVHPAIVKSLSERGELGPTIDPTARVFKTGVSHGAAGVLGSLLPLLIREPNRQSTLDDGVEWLLSTRNDVTCDRRYPDYVGFPDHLLNTGWCNGDIGIAAVVFRIGKALGNRAWQSEAIQVASREGQRTEATIEPLYRGHPGLCHGSAGLAHIFNRFFQWTGDQPFADAARYWLRQLLSARRRGCGLGGFSVRQHTGDGEIIVDIRSALMGAAGIGLALMAAACEVPPDWDRMLLLSAAE